MYRAGLQLARDASVEELLGNLQMYVQPYCQPYYLTIFKYDNIDYTNDILNYWLNLLYLIWYI